ncbi:hypothetical protein P0C94_002310 [Listeria innocua]|nr:hypothetical protein [Listeria innocua]
MHETQRFNSETYTIDMKHEPKASKSIYQLVETVYINKASKTKNRLIAHNFWRCHNGT